MTKEDILNLIGDFSWNYYSRFFIETENGNFVWNDPDYSGDNTLTRTKLNHIQWCKSEGIPYSRSKGMHIIRDYCGEDIIIKE